jgi:hypothetical protein
VSEPRESEEYHVAPLPETFDKASSPAYRPDAEGAPGDEYAVGPEVDDANLSVGATSWKEAAAGVHRQVDEFGVEPPVPTGGRIVARDAVRRLAERELAAARDAKIASPEDPTRFTLTGLFALVTVASLVFACGRWLPRGLFAGVSGLAAMLSLVMAKWFRRGGAVFHLAWWMLFGIYLFASIMAMMGL